MKYDIVYADPPWQQNKGGLRKCRPNQKRELDYTTLSLEEIKNIIKNFETLNIEGKKLVKIFY